MTEDLKQQASELYRQRTGTEELPSASLSMKRLVYIAIALVVLALVAIEVTFRFTRRQQPSVATTAARQATPIPPSGPAAASQPALTQPAETPTQAAQPPVETAPPEESQPSKVAQAPTPPAPKPAAETRARSAEQRSSTPGQKPAVSTPAQKPAVEAAPSPEETAQLELVRSILTERFPSLAPELRGPLTVEPQGPDTFQAILTRVDDATGSPAQYVWRVNSTTRSVTPLSYYARKLP